MWAKNTLFLRLLMQRMLLADSMAWGSRIRTLGTLFKSGLDEASPEKTGHD
jgi:hypothetical protein